MGLQTPGTAGMKNIKDHNLRNKEKDDYRREIERLIHSLP